MTKRCEIVLFINELFMSGSMRESCKKLSVTPDMMVRWSETPAFRRAAERTLGALVYWHRASILGALAAAGGQLGEVRTAGLAHVVAAGRADHVDVRRAEHAGEGVMPRIAERARLTGRRKVVAVEDRHDLLAADRAELLLRDAREMQDGIGHRLGMEREAVDHLLVALRVEQVRPAIGVAPVARDLDLAEARGLPAPRAGEGGYASVPPRQPRPVRSHVSRAVVALRAVPPRVAPFAAVSGAEVIAEDAVAVALLAIGNRLLHGEAHLAAPFRGRERRT